MKDASDLYMVNAMYSGPGLILDMDPRLQTEKEACDGN